MVKKKRSKKDKFGWAQPKSYNSPTDNHGDKKQSDKYSFKIPSKAKPSKLWCSPASPGVSKKRESPGRPYGYKPLYDQIDTYNYQSESARYSRAVERMPDRIWNKLYFYRASDGCYNHIVIPPDFEFDDFIKTVEQIPFEFKILAPQEFWLNFPVPKIPNPGGPLIPGGNIIVFNAKKLDDIDWLRYLNNPNWLRYLNNPDWLRHLNNPDWLRYLNGIDWRSSANNIDWPRYLEGLEWSSISPEDWANIDFGDGFDPDGFQSSTIIPRFGCTDPEAENYDPLAEIDDGSCILPGRGCTDPEADNYDPNAVYDNGSCTYTEEEVPQGSCLPVVCTIQSQYDGRWVVVTKEQALNGLGCPIGFVNNGYAELLDGSYQVLCSRQTAQGSIVERLWYRYPGEDWIKVDSSAEGLYSWYIEPTFYVSDNQGMIVTREGVRPMVYFSCKKPGDTPQALDPAKIQSEDCPLPWLGEVRILMEGPDGYYVGGDREIPTLVVGFSDPANNLTDVILQGIDSTGIGVDDWMVGGFGANDIPGEEEFYAVFYDSTGLLKKERINTNLGDLGSSWISSGSFFSYRMGNNGGTPAPTFEDDYNVFGWVSLDSSFRWDDVNKENIGFGYILPNVLSGGRRVGFPLLPYRWTIGPKCWETKKVIMRGDQPSINLFPTTNPWLVNSNGVFTLLQTDLNDVLERSDFKLDKLYVRARTFNYNDPFLAEGWTEIIIDQYTIGFDGSVTPGTPTTIQVYEHDPLNYFPIDATYVPYIVTEEPPP